jgi:hypothetical protein
MHHQFNNVKHSNISYFRQEFFLRISTKKNVTIPCLNSYKYVVACPLKARIVHSEETSITTSQHSKQNATIAELSLQEQRSCGKWC